MLGVKTVVVLIRRAAVEVIADARKMSVGNDRKKKAPVLPFDPA
jgi:hypothetical protein